METLPWAALVLFALYLMVIDANHIAIAVVIAAAAFTRFEGILLVVPYLIAIAMRPNSKKGIVPLAVVISAFIAFYIVKHEYYGVWISHAFQMKAAAAYYRSAPLELVHWWLLFVSIPLFLSVPTLLSRHYRFVLAYIVLSLVSVCFGPRSDFSRYSVHLLPPLYAFSSPVLAQMMARPRTATKVTALALVVLAIFAQALAGTIGAYRTTTSALMEGQVCREKVGQYINANINASEYIASSDLGEISYVAIGHRFVDLIGLTSKDVLARYREGQTADTLLAAKRVKYFADTYRGNSPVDGVVAYEYPLVRQKSAFTIEQPEFSCTAGGVTYFVAKLVLKRDVFGRLIGIPD